MTTDQLKNTPTWVREDIEQCSQCRIYEDIVLVCGWHENLTTAVRIVEVTGGTLVVEDADLLDGDR